MHAVHLDELYAWDFEALVGEVHLPKVSKRSDSCICCVHFLGIVALWISCAVWQGVTLAFTLCCRVHFWAEHTAPPAISCQRDTVVALLTGSCGQEGTQWRLKAVTEQKNVGAPFNSGTATSRERGSSSDYCAPGTCQYLTRMYVFVCLSNVCVEVHCTRMPLLWCKKQRLLQRQPINSMDLTSNIQDRWP